MRNEMRIEKSTLVLLVLLTYCDDNWKFRLSMRMKSEKKKHKILQTILETDSQLTKNNKKKEKKNVQMWKCKK